METGCTKKLSVLYFSQVEWNWIKQRPHFMPESLAWHECKVTFFALATGKHKPVNIEHENFQIKEVRGIRGSAKYFLSRKLNGIICKRYFGADFIGKVDVIILTYPFQYEFLDDELKRKPIIYDCMDNIPMFYEGKTSKSMIRMEEKLCNHAKKIITSSNSLEFIIKKRYGIENSKITVIRNALSNQILDNDYFDQISEKSNDLKNGLNEPNLVYAGTIGDWFDYELINNFAKQNLNIYIYLIGPKSKKATELEKTFPVNVIFTGPKSHKETMLYVKNSNIVIMPFKVNELIECVDPVKMYEYIGLGKKVVSAYWKELDYYAEISGVSFYKTMEEFDSLVKEFLLNTRELQIDLDFIDKNNWEKRAEDLYKIICECMGGQ